MKSWLLGAAPLMNFDNQVRYCTPPSEGHSAPCPSGAELLYCQSVSADVDRQSSLEERSTLVLRRIGNSLETALSLTIR